VNHFHLLFNITIKSELNLYFYEHATNLTGYK